MADEVIELLKNTQKDNSHSKTYLIFITVLCFFGVGSILSILLLRPGEDNTAIIATILGFLTPIIGTLMAVMIKDIHVSINSRMTELLSLTQKSARAEGKLEGVLNPVNGIHSSEVEGTIQEVNKGKLEKILPVTVKISKAKTVKVIKKDV